MRSFSITALVAAGLFFPNPAMSAQNITLKSQDGSINVEGTLISSEDGIITIRTAVGDMRVPANKVACSGAGCPQPVTPAANVIVRGSDTIGDELMPLLVEGYANIMQSSIAARQTYGDNITNLMVKDDFGAGDQLMTVAVQAAGSSVGLKALLADEAHIAMSSRAARRSEVVALLDQGRGDLLDLNQEYIIAVDSILTIVSPENPIDALSVDEISGLFSGRYTNWSEVGGADIPVTVYSRPETSGTRSVFEGQIFAGSGEAMSPNVVILPSNSEISDRVATEPGAIGYVGFAQKREAKSVDLIATCGIRMTATAFSAKTEEYPLERRLRLFTDNATLPDHARGLVDFAISSDADGLIQKAGFIDLSVDTAEDALDSTRLLAAAAEANDALSQKMLREMMLELNGATRLSTTFRFKTGSAELDNKSLRDFDRLVEHLQLPENRGKDVLLVGYTDSNGTFSSNAELSRDRAEAVRLALVGHNGPDALSGVRLAAAGYGELSPVGCNDDVKGRERNRRVEVWIR